jgi:hypothetical protein
MGAGRRRPTARIVGDVLLEKLAIHAAKLKRPQPAVFRSGLVTRVA